MYQFAKMFAEPYVALVVFATLLAFRTKHLFSTPSSRMLRRLLCLLWIISLPSVGWGLIHLLERPHRTAEVDPQTLDAIVVLGGGLVHDREKGESRLTVDAMGRCLTAAEVAADTDAVIIVSGGIPGSIDGAPSEASVMRDFLLQIGVAADRIVLEDQAKNTYENAVESVKLVKNREFQEVAVVTNGWHLKRSVACFANEGLDVSPIGCLWQSDNLEIPWYQHIVPRSQYLLRTQRAIHESIGLAWYAYKGRIEWNDLL